MLYAKYLHVGPRDNLSPEPDVRNAIGNQRDPVKIDGYEKSERKWSKLTKRLDKVLVRL